MSARLPVGVFLRFVDRYGADVSFRVQNFHRGKTRTFEAQDYIFANFGFSGTTVDRSAANVQASLAFGLNNLSLVALTNAVEQKWLVNIYTVWLDPDTLEEKNVWLQEVFQVTGMARDLSRINLQLGSPLDAITAQFPRRVLTQAIVGNLPTTGQIVLS